MKRDVTAVLPADPGELASQLGAGRAAIAAALLAAPVVSARLLGADGATAHRVDWLTRMMAVRDGALGVGALVAARRSGADAVPWLLGGAAADFVDAAVLAGAVRRGRLKGIAPRAGAVLAAGTAVVGAATALRLRRH
jgi:hypothetical protein